ncbi:YqaJ viral recombinase family protein [Acidithiobacillus caldus]
MEDGGILEIKTARLCSQGFWEESTPHYRIQVLHQLLVTGKAWAKVAVVIGGGQDLRTFQLDALRRNCRPSCARSGPPGPT